MVELIFKVAINSKILRIIIFKLKCFEQAIKEVMHVIAGKMIYFFNSIFSSLFS